MPSRKCSYKPCGIRVPKEQAIVRGVQAWCSEDCMIAYAMEAGKKLRAKQVTEENRIKVAHTKAIKDKHVPTQKALTQQVFNRMIRTLDKAQGCISCDKPASWSGQWHAGHYKTTGAYGMLRLDARNCHKQCSQCNNHLSGNLANYREGLLIRYGESLVQFLEGQHDAVKWTGEQLIEMRKEFSSEVRRLERGEQPSRDWRKLPD